MNISHCIDPDSCKLHSVNQIGPFRKYYFVFFQGHITVQKLTDTHNYQAYINHQVPCTAGNLALLTLAIVPSMSMNEGKLSK